MSDAHQHRLRRRAFTVVELIAVMAVVGTIAATITPVLVGASRNHTIASERRTSMDQLDFALSRIARILRDAPAGDGESASIVRALPTRIEFENGASVQQIGSTLWITVPGSSAAPLCTGVEYVEFQYLGGDGETDTAATPGETRRIRLELQIGESSLQSSVCLENTGAS